MISTICNYYPENVKINSNGRQAIRNNVTIEKIIFKLHVFLKKYIEGCYLGLPMKACRHAC